MLIHLDFISAEFSSCTIDFDQAKLKTRQSRQVAKGGIKGEEGKERMKEGGFVSRGKPQVGSGVAGQIRIFPSV